VSHTPIDTAKIIDTIIALDAIMPTLLDLLAKQGPDQRNTPNATLTYAQRQRSIR
jgi:hypothetical protein